MIYPALPWFGIMALGCGLGHVFLEPAAQRERQLSVLGLAAIALFLLLRGTNLYGDPRPWSAQGDGVMTALSVLNVTKYPPSNQGGQNWAALNDRFWRIAPIFRDALIGFGRG
jgi:uncharacterized membrane protein